MVILGHRFEGPYQVGKKLIDRAAVYVIITATDSVVDVGQSGEAGTRLANHDRSMCWKRNGGNQFVVKWMPTSKYTREDRERLEKSIRDRYNPPCGSR